MKVYFGSPDTVDCTADPHEVEFGAHEEMLNAVEWVLKSHLVRWIHRSRVKIGDTQYESDYLSKRNWSGDRTEITGARAAEEKIDGLFHTKEVSESSVEADRVLPNGLTGALEAIKVLRRYYTSESAERKQGLLRIPVVWAFAGDSSCADYIDIADINVPVADFSNQDWWVDKKGYEEHLNQLGEIVGYRVSGRSRYES